jgi:hypothetical protein
LNFSIWESDQGRRGKLLGKVELRGDQFQRFGFDGELLVMETTGGTTSYLKVRAHSIRSKPGLADRPAPAQKLPKKRRSTSGHLGTSSTSSKPDAGAATPAGGNAGAATTEAAANPAAFQAPAEVLYRGLLGELHEDAYHDQTAMLAALLHALISLGERLTPAHHLHPPGGDGERKLVGLAELSAVLRLFFPTKPREHLNSVKRLLADFVKRPDKGSKAGGSAGTVPPADEHKALSTPKKSAADSSPQRTVSSRGLGSTPSPESRKNSRREGPLPPTPLQLAQKTQGRLHIPDEEPEAEEVEVKQDHDTTPTVDLEEAFGVKLPPIGMTTDKEVRARFLHDLVNSDSPLVIELRRQHIIESMAFLERIQKSLRLAGLEGGTVISVKQADAALQKVDKNFTEDQRRFYLLRGFGRRLPDIPPVKDKQDAAVTEAVMASSRALTELRAKKTIKATDVNIKGVGAAMSKLLVKEEMCAQAVRVQKIRKLLKERATSLSDEGATCAVDDFVKRVAATGVVKGARMWQVDIKLDDAVQEVGLINVRSLTATAPLEHFISPGKARPDVDEPSAPPRNAVRTSGAFAGAVGTVERQKNRLGRLEWYQNHVEAGRDIQEVSVGFPGIALSWWVAGIA